MRAFLEKNEKEWMDDFVYASVYPLLELGIEVIPFNGNIRSSLDSYQFDLKNDIIIGSVDRVEYFFRECGIEPPKYLGYPYQLEKYLGRKTEITTIKKLYEADSRYPYFIKPWRDVKLFTGDVIKGKNYLDMLLSQGVSENTDVYRSACVDFLSEYRCFVHKGELKGIQWYTGNFKLMPDVKVIEAMVTDYKDAPVSYTLDVGLVRNTKPFIKGDPYDTILVEVNDMWAIGSYGFNGKDYVRMTIDRFQEIYRNSTK